MKAVYSNKSLNSRATAARDGRGSSVLQRMKEEYDIDLSNYYRMSN